MFPAIASSSFALSCCISLRRACRSEIALWTQLAQKVAGVARQPQQSVEEYISVLLSVPIITRALTLRNYANYKAARERLQDYSPPNPTDLLEPDMPVLGLDGGMICRFTSWIAAWLAT